MNKTYSAVLTICCILMSGLKAQAQFAISGEYRPRAEYRHGWKTLPAPNQKAAFFVDQRTRLNFLLNNEKYDFKVVIQDVRTWGSQSQLVANDGSLTTLHEAWARVNLSDAFGAKVGRQEIIYDDHRIFGNVGWAQQARSHDAALLMYNKNDLQIDLGLAFNQDTPQINTSFYTVPNSYKTFQYLWAHKRFEDFKVSLLFLNNGKQGGIPSDYKTYFSQTFGTRLSYSNSNINGNLALYKQTGTEPDAVTDISAGYVALDLSYTFNENSTLIGGFEFFSGNDPTSTVNENNAFNPFYGTNHKFNGLMDYFYVGNHLSNAGLQDFYFTFNQKFSKMNGGITAHFFSSAEKLQDPLNGGSVGKGLGTEVDLVYGYNVNEELNLKAGYSQMFATSSMEILKGGDKNETSNWAWVMLTIKPTFFTTKKDDHAD